MQMVGLSFYCWNDISVMKIPTIIRCDGSKTIRGQSWIPETTSWETLKKIY